jgi:hypothetical protein
MPKARDTATDRLSNVIEVVELGRRTGLLSAERGMGAGYEEGEIYFVLGRAMYAAIYAVNSAVTSSAAGREALAALGQWGNCHFAFDPTADRPAANLAAAFGDTGPQLGASPSWPAPAPNPAANGSAWGPPPTAARPPHGVASRALPGLGGSAVPGRSPTPAPRTGQIAAASGSGPLGRRPRRAPDARDLREVVASLNLSRNHRTLLLLADGTHSVLDLARLASKPVDEITQILAELEARGLIYYYG